MASGVSSWTSDLPDHDADHVGAPLTASAASDSVKAVESPNTTIASAVQRDRPSSTCAAAAL
jgi:hypothetical protein